LLKVLAFIIELAEHRNDPESSLKNCQDNDGTNLQMRTSSLVTVTELNGNDKNASVLSVILIALNNDRKHSQSGRRKEISSDPETSGKRSRRSASPSTTSHTRSRSPDDTQPRGPKLSRRKTQIDNGEVEYEDSGDYQYKRMKITEDDDEEE